MLKMKKLSKKSTIIGLAMLLLLTGGASAYYVKSHDSKAVIYPKVAQHSSTKKKSPTPAKNETVTPVTKKQANPAPTPSNQPPGATVIITHVEQTGNSIAIGAYADQQPAGTCTVTFTHGADVVTKNVTSYVDASGKSICDFPSDVRCVDTGSGTTACKDPFIKRSDFPVAGQWQVIVRFTASAISGQSAAQTITIT